MSAARGSGTDCARNRTCESLADRVIFGRAGAACVTTGTGEYARGGGGIVFGSASEPCGGANKSGRKEWRFFGVDGGWFTSSSGRAHQPRGRKRG